MKDIQLTEPPQRSAALRNIVEVHGTPAKRCSLRSTRPHRRHHAPIGGSGAGLELRHGCSTEGWLVSARCRLARNHYWAQVLRPDVYLGVLQPKPSASDSARRNHYWSQSVAAFTSGAKVERVGMSETKEARPGRYFTLKNRGIRHRLFQAAMWRKYYRYYSDFERVIIGVSRKDCLRLARANVYMAHRINRAAKG